MTVCTCRYGELADTACRIHGLYGGVRFPPMDRHARDGETAAEAQRRLYAASLGDQRRMELAGFPLPLRGCPPREMGQR